MVNFRVDFRKKCGINRTFAKINPREKRKRRKRRLWIGARKNILINFYNFIIIIYSWNINMFHGWKNDLMSFYFVFGLSAMFFWPWHDLVLVCSGRFLFGSGRFLVGSCSVLVGSSSVLVGSGYSKRGIWEYDHSVEVPPSQVYLSLFGFFVFAFTLDICFYFENIRALAVATV